MALVDSPISVASPIEISSIGLRDKEFY